MSVNKAILLGNVGNDPEVRLAGEHKVATFSLATTERGYTLKNGTQVPETTTWHNIVLWRGLAEIAEKFVKKGDKLYIEGKIKTRSYDDKNGVKRYITEIFADNIDMLGGKPNTTKDGATTYQSEQTKVAERAKEFEQAPPSDDLPF